MELCDQTTKPKRESPLSYFLYIETVTISWITRMSNLESQLFHFLNDFVFRKFCLIFF